MPFQPSRLKDLREAKGWSQEQLAKRAGLSQAQIAKTESGTSSPRSEALDKLAEALDCSIDYLHGRGRTYESPALAAAQMAFEAFIAKQTLNDDQRERCRRVLRHPNAPKTMQAWTSFAEQVELALGPPVGALSLVTEPVAKSKPISAPRPSSRSHRVKSSVN